MKFLLITAVGVLVAFGVARVLRRDPQWHEVTGP
ncbi:hypothetical protein SAMN05444695_11640 [Rhodococcus triatomae]|uniref:Uncharacterized protein n=1 Tax=Rhodococcus triatomae TaxID=300028 RepID=A0A1G8QX96_9NOCA|nr:hypothetical protein SAMN05444695_11640 [Rhodococcus triatomae]